MSFLFSGSSTVLLSRLIRFSKLARLFSGARDHRSCPRGRAARATRLPHHYKRRDDGGGRRHACGRGEIATRPRLALPIAIIGRGFYEEIRCRDFVVTFALVAHVPLFARLDAPAISDLVGILMARAVPARTVIIRKGEPGDAMYFIASGMVEVEASGDKVRTQGGDFFGEMALLKRERRTVTVTAIRSTDLLVLDCDDFHRFIDRNPEMDGRSGQSLRDG